jgi:hypothetical protein
LQITFFFFLVATFFIVEDSEFIDVGFNLVWMNKWMERHDLKLMHE